MFRIPELPLPVLTGSPTEPRFPPIQFQKESPREKEKAWKGGNGARADAPTSGRRGAALESHHGLQCVRFGIASPRARRVAGHSGLLVK